MIDARLGTPRGCAGHAKHHQKDLTDAPERELEDALPACRAVQHLTVPGWCPGHASLFTMSIIRKPGSDDHTAYEALCIRISRCTPLDTQTPRGWWSQTGSNRRPHACKARALPTELWPRIGVTHSPGAGTTPTDPKGPQGRPAARADARSSLRRRTSPPALEAT